MVADLVVHDGEGNQPLSLFEPIDPVQAGVGNFSGRHNFDEHSSVLQSSFHQNRNPTHRAGFPIGDYTNIISQRVMCVNNRMRG
ncbi:MAG: hypothetical protein BWY68_00636 [bacterium ADurb.Bin400]|nr:MAG: hypothetical protein BWY68_00636 [bacterium ADurb.Bin400]